MFNILPDTKIRVLDRHGNCDFFVTRKSLNFTCDDRIRAEHGFLAFLSNGKEIIVRTNDVVVSQSIALSVRDGLRALRSVRMKKRDYEWVYELTQQNILPTSELFRAAFIIRDYKVFLDINPEIIDSVLDLLEVQD